MANSAMKVEEFHALVADAKKRNPKCCYCGKNLATADTKDVMYMKGQKRIACNPCPEAMEIKFS